MMLAELCFGIFFNLSLWYKLTDRTQWGMYFSLICFVLMLGLNVWLVPMIGIPDGYMGSACAALISYFVVMVMSYFAGKKYYPLPYQTGRIFMYLLLAGVLYVGGRLMDNFFNVWITYALRFVLLMVYVGVVALFEEIPFLSPLMRRLKR